MIKTAPEIKIELGESLKVSFGSKIEPSGDYVYVIVEKHGIGVSLTPAQAKSLAEQINARIA